MKGDSEPGEKCWCSVRRYAVLATVLGLSACLDKCGDKKTGAITSEAAAEAGGGNVAAGSLILAAREQGAFLPPELADPRYADESTLPMGPFHLPATDFSRAGTEIEPNNTAAVAMLLGEGLAIRGELTAGDYDHYVFETSGETQLWAIEAVGKSVGNLLYATPGNEKVQAQRVDSGRLVIPNLHLAAGKHSIEVRPSSSVSGPYTLRAVPLGQPDLRMEREPNDLESFAHGLRAGIPRVGLLLAGDDRDSYSFALREPGHISLQVTSPPDVTLKVNVYRQTGWPSHTFLAKSKGESMRMDMTLPPGDYLAVVRSNDNGSLTPYKVRLDQLDPFSSPADREPNNEHREAAPLPSDLVLRGSVGEYSDDDWYRLPTLSQETSMRMQILGMSGGMTPQKAIFVVDRTGDRNQNLNWAKSDSVWEMRLPANAPLFIQLYGKGEYQLRLSFNPGIPPIPGKAPFTVSLPPGPHLLEAFSTLAQRQSLPVTVHNPGAQRIQVALDAVVSHNAWSVTPSRQVVTVDAGKQIQVPLELNLPPDAGTRDAVQIAVRASSAAGSASATTKVYALCGAMPVNAHTYLPLPGQMLGGLNLAATSLGAHPVTTEAKLARQQLLYDGVTPNDIAWFGQRSESEPAVTLTVALAGDRAATVAGVTLIPGNGDPSDQVDQFDVLVSEDGQTFRQVMSGRLRPAVIEQVFMFAQPVRARFAQLRLRSNQPGRTNNPYALVTLGEWKVIGAPGEHPFTTAGFNIADPAMGGHVVWSQPLFQTVDAVLSGAVDGSALRFDPATPIEWVVGFRHNRAAQIARLEWVQPAANVRAKMLSAVDVSVSAESPIGPWTPVGSWKIPSAPGGMTAFNLAQPVWGRFVRFSATEPKKVGENWQLAESIRIFERGPDATYRSVLAEWGHYARAAIYERMVVAPAAPNAEEITGNGKRDDARKIESGKAYRGRVVLEEDEDWYRIDMPGDHNRLRVNLQGDPMVRAVATLQDESGNIIPATTRPGLQAGTTQVDAIVAGGKTYFLRLIEPPRSIALAWDNSGSVTPFAPTLYRALGRFVEAVQPRREFVNLLPFQDVSPKFLLSSWSDQPYVLQGAVQNYSRVDGSSNAEISLLAVAEDLEKRQGSRAILFITDAASGGYDKTAALWAALNRVAARVFAVELHIGNQAGKQQQLMRDWADVNDGHYSTFRTSDDMDMAFELTSCYLRRPVRYTLTAETRFEVPSVTGGIANALAKTGRVDVYGVYFDLNSATLKPESGPVLKEISDALVKNPAWKLNVEGHTDNVGDDALNMRLSRNRAASVKQALVTRFGIVGDRLATAGFGASKPKESNRTSNGRARNRRVELVRQ